MADFWQSPDLVTIHNLHCSAGSSAVERLLDCTRESPVGTVIPVHYRDVHGQAMTTIIRELGQSGISANTVIVLNGANAAQAEEVAATIEQGDRHIRLLWAESRYVEHILDHVERCHGVKVVGGKGAACWLGLGYLLQCTNVRAVAFQDADVENFSAEMPARLLLPLVFPESGIAVSKAYYSRTGDRMYGRLTRQFLTPFVHAMRSFFPGSGFASLLTQLRYPLSGEIGMSRDFALNCRVPCGWSLEINTLWDVQRMGMMASLCQVDIADQYFHKHHPVVSEDPCRQTLQAMASEIGTDLLALLAKEGNILSQWHQKAFLEKFARFAAIFHRAYACDARCNGIPWFEEDEIGSIREFTKSAAEAVNQYRRNPAQRPTLPSWKSIAHSMPTAAELLYGACHSPGPLTCAA